MYKKKYEMICNIKIPKGYVVHHIDKNRKNNDIKNLVLLPEKLHQRYHILLSKIEHRYEIVTQLLGSLDKGVGINDYIKCEQAKTEAEFIEVWYECLMYVDYRDYLLGRLPNIHNIKI